MITGETLIDRQGESRIETRAHAGQDMKNVRRISTVRQNRVK